MKTLLLSAFVLVSTLPLAAQQPAKVPVFVQTEANASGFTDPDKPKQDSMRDIQKKLEDSKTLTLAQSATDAVVRLEVVGRKDGYERTGHLENDRTMRYWVTFKILADGFTSDEITVMDSGHYRGAAARVVKRVEDWVKANQSKLAAHR